MIKSLKKYVPLTETAMNSHMQRIDHIDQQTQSLKSVIDKIDGDNVQRAIFMANLAKSGIALVKRK